ncbi:MAG: hypothetical protein OEV74_11350 [Cyclobacteriaceae bacterium]|nr:hypothetical protein [Cyclobacteriaceae bacterium]MDH4296869.1 hypothetical protein [Cyclobacteriaceae bacterium]MDH5249505.1 hypothetical protein [Cyclobacteriaceae bacterium]
MRKLVFIILPMLLLGNTAWGQAKTRRLPSIINHPSLNLYAPFISFDGDALLFVSDDGEDHSLTVSYTSRVNDWSTPVVLPKQLNHRLVYQNGFALNADGKTMYFTSSKSPTVGGYDIMMSELKGTTWTEPQNLMLPINTKSNEGCPSITADGNRIYFMRCDRMDQNKADGCKLFFSTKQPNGQWDTPKELPANINTGNSQTPRIMADGETLIFSSDKMPSRKGGMDLYLSRFRDGRWTDPVPMDFANTDQDDQFVSVAALGRYLLKDTRGARKTNELVEFLIPDELRPKGMMKVEGNITDEKNLPVSAYISVTDLVKNERIFSGRPNADGSYMVYLMEGTHYEMSIDPEQSNVNYFAKQFDLTTDRTPQRERVNVILKEPEAGDELSLDLISFKPYSAELAPESEAELKKLARVVKANPQLKFQIQVVLSGYVQDSTQSDPDLTEIMVDSVTTYVDATDTLGQVYQRDTIVVNTFYHNDRTLQQAESIIAYLIMQGASQDSFTYLGNAIPAMLPEEKKLIVKALVQAN